MKPRTPELWKEVRCPTCGTVFTALVSEKRRFCSRPCIRRSPEERSNISHTLIGSGEESRDLMEH